MNADKGENIRAEHTFFERAGIDKSKADKKRLSPDLSDMWGAEVTSDMPAGGTKTTCYYWTSEKRRDKNLPGMLTRHIKPRVKLINKK